MSMQFVGFFFYFFTQLHSHVEFVFEKSHLSPLQQRWLSQLSGKMWIYCLLGVSGGESERRISSGSTGFTEIAKKMAIFLQNVQVFASAPCDCECARTHVHTLGIFTDKQVTRAFWLALHLRAVTWLKASCCGRDFWFFYTTWFKVVIKHWRSANIQKSKHLWALLTSWRTRTVSSRSPLSWLLQKVHSCSWDLSFYVMLVQIWTHQMHLIFNLSAGFSRSSYLQNLNNLHKQRAWGGDVGLK